MLSQKYDAVRNLLECGVQSQIWTRREAEQMQRTRHRSHPSNTVYLDRVDKPVSLNEEISIAQLASKCGGLTSPNDCGCEATYALQFGLAPAQPLDAQTSAAPAQSPQNVMSKIYPQLAFPISLGIWWKLTHNIHVRELGIKVTASKVSLWLAPRIGVWVSVADISGHVASSEIPNFNPRVGPVCSIHSSTIGIEGGSVADCRVRLNTLYLNPSQRMFESLRD